MENEEQKSEQEERRFEPKVVFDGTCNHYFEESGLDPEGIMQAQCKKCWMGRRYRKEEYECRDGRIIAKNTN